MNLPYLYAISDERTTCNPRHAKFSHRLAKIAQTVQNKRATGNAIVATATLTRVKVATRRDFFVKSLLKFCKFLVNSNFDLKPNCIFRNTMKRRFHDILSVRKYCQLFTRVEYKNILKNAIHTNGRKTPDTSPSP